MTALDDAGPRLPQVIFDRPPTTPNELWECVRVMWGVELPRTPICDGHSSPFDAFCEGYFGNHGNYSLWYGSRGTGKSLMLAILGLTKTALLGINATLLGGSMAQSKNVHEHVENLMRSPYAPRHAVDKQIQTELSYKEGNWIRPLPASQRTVRGPHPQLVLLDEIDEMDYDVYTAAQGQAMAKPNTRGVMVPEMTIASSTWQNPIGTFKTVMDNAQRNDLSIHTWCVDGDALVRTTDGMTPLKDVGPGSSVLTRTGWYEVQHNTFMGIKPAVKVTFENGSTLRCTPDHKVATASGWTEAGSLALGTLVFTATLPADPVSPVRPDPDVDGISEVMPAPTLSGSAAGALPRTSGVLALSDNLQVLDIDAQGVAAQVIQDQTIRDGSDMDSPHSPVSVHGGSLAIPVDGSQAVPGSGGPGPDNTFGFWESQLFDPEADPAAQHVSTTHVVSVETIPAIPVYDIGVERANEFTANGIVVHNCWRETSKPHGWLDPAFIERKRLSVPAEMFRVEYELGEPAGDSRAFDLNKLNEAFIDLAVVNERDQHADHTWVFEEPEAHGLYAAGVDWAKSVDNTVIVIQRIDVEPWQTVYLRIFNRKPWPYMIDQFNTVVTRYQAVSAHDATGLGNVVHDLVDERTMKVVMMGADRVKLLTDYITAVERGKYRLPRNVREVFDAHRGTTVDEVFAPGKWNSHLADEVAAFAIAHRAATRVAPPAYGGIVKRSAKDEPLLGWQKHVNARTEGTSELLVARDGEVSEYVEDSDTKVFWL